MHKTNEKSPLYTKSCSVTEEEEEEQFSNRDIIHHCASTSIINEKNDDKNGGVFVSEKPGTYWDLPTGSKEDGHSNRTELIILPRCSTELSDITISPSAEGLHNSDSISNIMFNATSPFFTINNKVVSEDGDAVTYTTEKILPIKSKKLPLDIIGMSQQLQKVEEDGGDEGVEKAEKVLAMYIKILAVSSMSNKEKVKILRAILSSIERAWTLPTKGRKLAYRLCDVLRQSGGINIILEQLSDQSNLSPATESPPITTNSTSSNPPDVTDGGKKKDMSKRDLMLQSASVLAQSMTVPNREYVANIHDGLKTIVSTADKFRGDREVTRAALGILESLFKHTEVTCKRLIQAGGLDSILFACRHFDKTVLRPCAVALANLALYGDEECHQFMIARNAPEWLFPLAFSEDDAVRYYAFIAIAALRANKSIEGAVTRSGTLHLIEPFLRHRDPAHFGLSDRSHMHGHSNEWLLRMRSLLLSGNPQVTSLAAFHFAMEAAIKKRQNNLEMLRELGIVEELKKIAHPKGGNTSLACKFAREALEIMEESCVDNIDLNMSVWSVKDVCWWLMQNDVNKDLLRTLREDPTMDIDILLHLTDDQLKKDFNVSRSVDRAKFLREMSTLKERANYDSCEVVTLEVKDFLKRLGGPYLQYTYQMCRAGVDTETLTMLTDDHLLKDCGISNGIHRSRILQAAKQYPVKRHTTAQDHEAVDKCLDVFISYRRSNGSQLASLLKVHLQLRGYSVFLDIEKLTVGKFDENLIKSIRSCRNFLLILTSNALDRCIGDDMCSDWIHREIGAALKSSCTIIPIIDQDFEYPAAHLLPQDISHIGSFNAIRWIHDYQDACIDKLEVFINNPTSDQSANLLKVGQKEEEEEEDDDDDITLKSEKQSPLNKNNNNDNNNKDNNDNNNGNNCILNRESSID